MNVSLFVVQCNHTNRLCSPVKCLVGKVVRYRRTNASIYGMTSNEVKITKRNYGPGLWLKATH
jgi:hypothetical protein